MELVDVIDGLSDDDELTVLNGVMLMRRNGQIYVQYRDGRWHRVFEAERQPGDTIPIKLMLDFDA